MRRLPADSSIRPHTSSARARTALATVALLALGIGAAAARDSDRTQNMNIGAAHSEGSLEETGVYTFTGAVLITQGTLEIRADRADIHRTGGDIARAVLVGKQATLKQQMNDGTWMNARADRIDYDTRNDVIVLIGNYTVSTPRGSTNGQRLTYDLKSSRLESGGDSGRVSMTFVPKSAQGGAEPKPAPKPASGSDAKPAAPKSKP
ncbi:MAG: lipopolysaccharide transport periplasmic protein LptA [Lysobacter sp.]|nr:MAG: lipopolysaccharide transport periplasmic protein LptA [Lysobacter sp.]